ncbi:MAG: hypothetical protein ABWX71_05370 [Aeromicrobium sp.]
MDWLWVVVMAVRAASPAADDRWAVSLAELDEQRAVAFARAEPRRLEGVYVRGSRALSADARTISRYATRDARVVGARLRILSCRVIDSSSRRVRLDVVDRLGPARIAWGDGSTTPLPDDEPSRRVVTLSRTDHGWRISASAAMPAE